MKRNMILRRWRERNTKIEEYKPGVEREKMKFKMKIRKRKIKGNGARKGKSKI